MGTWHMGENAGSRAEVDALRAGLDLGMHVIDTAEMYAEGGAESVVGRALRGRRGDAFVVTKFYPHHAAEKPLRAACAASLRRLDIDRIDLYLLHWRGPVPLAETVGTLESLVDQGRVAHWGVSNFDVADMEELLAVPGGERCHANQVLYNLARRGIEFDLLPWCSQRGIDIMAYSPLDEGRLLAHPVVRREAARLSCSAAQLALAWLLREPRACVIPKSSRVAHVRANAAARDVMLDAEALQALDVAFPPPHERKPLEMI